MVLPDNPLLTVQNQDEIKIRICNIRLLHQCRKLENVKQEVERLNYWSM